MSKKKIKKKVKDKKSKDKPSLKEKIKESEKNYIKLISQKLKNLKKEKEKNERLEEIYNVKYVGCGYCDDLEPEGFEAFNENGEKVGYDDFGMYCGFDIDVDEGKILRWPEKGMYLKLCIKVCDTCSYSFSDKNGNKIYDNWGYAPDFLAITSELWGGDYIEFETDIHGYIKGWKEKNIKQKIINYLIQERIEGNY